MSDNIVPVLNRTDLVKDTSSGGVLNTDNTALAAYKARKNRMRNDAQRIERLEGELSDIKQMLTVLMENRNANN